MLLTMTSLVGRLLPQQLWQRVQPLLPAPPPRPHGGLRGRVPDRNRVAALIFMARTSTPWSLLPVKELGCGSATTCWRRLDQWAHAGVFEQPQAVLLDELVLEPLGEELAHAARGDIVVLAIATPQVMLGSP
jgi:transposase